MNARRLPEPLGPREERVRRLLAGVEKNYSPSVFASAFGAEDMVVLDLIARDGLAIPVVTIDSGRLPSETHALIARVRKDYGLDIEVYKPWPDSVGALVEEQGHDGFYDGLEQRKACCGVRKAEPLRRALASRRAWITAQRRERSSSGAELAETALDSAHGIWRFSPLVDWTAHDVWTYLRANKVPYNALHDRGYASIGCAPCTRAVAPDAHPRAGRWWWEQEPPPRAERALEAIRVSVVERV